MDFVPCWHVSCDYRKALKKPRILLRGRGKTLASFPLADLVRAFSFIDEFADLSPLSLFDLLVMKDWK